MFCRDFKEKNKVRKSYKMNRREEIYFERIMTNLQKKKKNEKVEKVEKILNYKLRTKIKNNNNQL